MATKRLKEFFAEFGLVTVALGFVVGTASASLINSIVDNLIMPAILAFVPGREWETVTWTVGNADLLWGLVLSELIKLVMILILTYIIVKKVLRYSRPI